MAQAKKRRKQKLEERIRYTSNVESCNEESNGFSVKQAGITRNETNETEFAHESIAASREKTECEG
jgi:hypothetical protein